MKPLLSCGRIIMTRQNQWYVMVICYLLAGTATASAGIPDQPWFPQAPPLPKPAGQVLRASTADEIFQAASVIKPGGTILIAPGYYFMPRTLELRTDNITLRGDSDNRLAVVLDGARSRHGELLAITGCSGVTIA